MNRKPHIRGAKKEEGKEKLERSLPLIFSLSRARARVFAKTISPQCDVMSEDEPGLLKQQQQKSTKQHETCVGSKAEEQEEKEEREVGATRAPEEKAAAKNPPPPRASSSAPTEDGTGEKREKNSSPSPALFVSFHYYFS